MVSGSPLSTEVAVWFSNTFPERVGLFSGSGGTDMAGGGECFQIGLCCKVNLDSCGRPFARQHISGRNSRPQAGNEDGNMG